MRYSANAVTQAQLKAKQGKAPVWLYQFEWETPVMGGVFGTPHATEIPFAFDTLGKLGVHDRRLPNPHSP